MQIRALWMRGGTSKCWVFEADALENSTLTPDQVLLRAFGSPDLRQLDGVGGGTSTTSKAVIVEKSQSSEADVNFTFAQVGIDEPKVDWGSNCGNCSSTVGLFAIERGWVKPSHPHTSVRVFNENTSQLIVETVDTPGGQLHPSPSERMIGTPFGGHKVLLGFHDPEGATTGKLFPTGQQSDLLRVGNSVVNAVLTDAGAPTVLLAAEDLQLDPHTYTEWQTSLMRRLPQIDDSRREAAVLMGLAKTPSDAERAIPKIGIISSSPDADADVQVLMFSMGKPHPAIPITASIAVTKAVRANQKPAPIPAVDPQILRIRTPVGVIETHHEEGTHGTQVGVVRTARKIAEADIFIPEEENIFPLTGAK